ncbi:acylphosphatase [Lutimonas saemankumensis]|uniref:acylphosphatase n=1 Tax=Lutimonas saemankumensis TaxID=483016 RepID=UPI001CD42D04|nr:acylphosphatase [Lutimonas saemankumensis]MCA0931563.1 acylphosphatase [Lutimonas saemankumensis]
MPLKKYFLMTKNYRIRVIGVVQGVWFRKYTKEAADKRSIIGFVRNEPNGSVFIEAQGDARNLEFFVDWLYQGSPLSKVEEVQWEEGEAGSYEGFSISR